jgi:hypothetical protein
MNMKKFGKYLSIAELVLLVVMAGYIVYQQTDTSNRNQMRDRDIFRISSLNQIRFALDEYKDKAGAYPPCLYKSDTCVSLEGSDAMPVVPRDPLDNNQFSYAAFGAGSSCTAFHVGTSLERTASQALLVGADAPPQPDSALCHGSAPDFSGLSYAPGGQLCNKTAGTAQPTDSSDGETCFDLKNRIK